jgi:hypothetical protein
MQYRAEIAASETRNAGQRRTSRTAKTKPEALFSSESASG